MNNNNDSAEWILRTTRKILREVGAQAARKFLEGRGGTAKWQAASQEIARAIRANDRTHNSATKVAA